MVMPSISPSFTGGAAGPSTATGGDQDTKTGTIDIGFSNAFQVGGEGNTATASRGQDFTMILLAAMGGFLLWTVLRKK